MSENKCVCHSFPLKQQNILFKFKLMLSALEKPSALVFHFKEWEVNFFLLNVDSREVDSKRLSGVEQDRDSATGFDPRPKGWKFTFWLMCSSSVGLPGNGLKLCF